MRLATSITSFSWREHCLRISAPKFCASLEKNKGGFRQHTVTSCQNPPSFHAEGNHFNFRGSVHARLFSWFGLVRFLYGSFNRVQQEFSLVKCAELRLRTRPES